jgi:hypothetical protein
MLLIFCSPCFFNSKLFLTFAAENITKNKDEEDIDSLFADADNDSSGRYCNATL